MITLIKKVKSNTNTTGDRRGGQIVWCDKSYAFGVMNPEVGTLEDPNGGRPVHRREKKKEAVSLRCQGEKM